MLSESEIIEGVRQELILRAKIHAHRATLIDAVPGMREQYRRDEQELIDITATLDEHPDGYDGPCWCAVCQSYANS
jgi:hypothetical protein